MWVSVTSPRPLKALSVLSVKNKIKTAVKALVYQVRTMAPRRVATSCEALAEETPGALFAVGSGGPASPLLRSFWLFWKTNQGMCSPRPFPPPWKLHSEMGRQLDAKLGRVAEISCQSPSSYTAERIDSPDLVLKFRAGSPQIVFCLGCRAYLKFPANI